MKSLRGVILAIATLSALIACGGAPQTLPTPPPGAVVVTAQGTAFTTQNVSAPAGTAFTLFFENLGNELHNVRLKDAAGTSVFGGQTFTGPAAVAEQVPALAAGTYRISCDIHPDMSAQLVAQ
ncbi:MAG: Cupredoxin-like domain [Chloroflexota bacterium]|nr:Cupredoxin-like domain [Chloroflexota bacterium]